MSDTRITSLRCEYLVNPEGIDERWPRLSWMLESGRRGARQVAWRVRVAQTERQLGLGEADLWDSGRIESAQTVQVAYAGQSLRSRDVCYWNVEAWDETGDVVLSSTAHWSLGLLEKSDWTARWIAADPEIVRRDPDAIEGTLTEPGTPGWFRREFAVAGSVRRAVVYATARGIFELRLNGNKIGQDLFAPEWTDYDKRVHYRAYDITGQLTPGRHTLTAVLGDGWWSGFVGWQEKRGRHGSLENSLLVQLEVELTDGSKLIVTSDESWACATGPILSSDFMMGETFDARRVPRQWLPVREVPAPSVPLVAQRSEPVQITEFLPAISRKEIFPGVQIYDLGQNITGWIRLKVTAEAGTRIQIRHGERLRPDGTLYTENLRRAKSIDVYVCRGGGEEVWEPRFTFHGFQYVEISGLAEALPTTAVTGCAVHSAMPEAGRFDCSHTGVNRLWLNGVWSQRDNFLSVPTDCPQRDERLGWMGDAQVFLRTATCNRDVAAFFTKWMTDVEDAQTADGIFPDIAPRNRETVNFVGLDDLCGAAGWADAGIIVPWTIWRVYGDRRILERHWRAMTAWLDYVERTNPDGLRTQDLRNNYGDWLCIPTDTTFRTHSPMKNFLATAYWADDATKMARMARELGYDADAKRFQAMFEKVRMAFQAEFVRADGELTVKNQTAYLLALAFDLLPRESRVRAAERLVEDIRSLDWHLSTGFIGISHLNPVLTLAGHADVAYKLLLQDSYPSWLYPVKHGATTIWERWNGWTHEEGFFNPHMNSFNHYSLGSVGEWLFRHVAGIELDPIESGFQRFVLKPFPRRGLDFARASYRSLHGEIVSHWKRTNNQLSWSVRIPANTSAQICIPCDQGTNVQSDGLVIRGREAGFVLCEAGAGNYTFTSTFSA